MTKPTDADEIDEVSENKKPSSDVLESSTRGNTLDNFHNRRKGVQRVCRPCVSEENKLYKRNLKGESGDDPAYE